MYPRCNKPSRLSQLGYLYLGAKRSLMGGGKWTPAKNWPTSATPGLWYEPSLTNATLFQDSAGTAPVTAVGQPTGRMLDRSGRSNHISQATAASRPLVNARVNLLAKTEAMTDPIWVPRGFAPALAILAPDGTNTAFRYVENNTDANPAVYYNSAVLAGSQMVGVMLRSSAPVTLALSTNGSTSGGTVNVTTDWSYFSKAGSTSSPQGTHIGGYSSVVRNSGITLDVWHPQQEIGSVTSRYQRVNTAADYDTAGFPQFLTFDGVDDGMATGPITLGADMDCFIAIRRNSAAVIAVCAGSVPGSAFLWVPSAGNGTPCHTGSGTPTFAVNGVLMPGDTRDQLNTAWPVGQWVVLEARNANLLSANWGMFGLSNYPSVRLSGDIGDVIICPAGNAAARQKNRQSLGAKVGLTLP